MRPDTFYIIDGHAQIHRAYHAPMQQLSGPKGSCSCIRGGAGGSEDECLVCSGTGREPTTVTHGFLQVLEQVVKRCQPSYLAVCYDGPRSQLKRRQLCPKYKAGRPDTPAALTAQVERIKQVVKLLGVASFQEPGYEADDLIATLARKCVSDDVHIRIVSRDKDMGSLLSDPRILMYDAHDDCNVGPEWIQKRFKVKPEQMEDYLVMVGDGVDGISGIPGVGEKAALEILGNYGSIEALLAVGQDSIEAKRYKKFWKGVQDGSLKLARQLVRLDCEAPIRVRASELECNGLDFRKAAPVLRALGFRRWEQRHGE